MDADNRAAHASETAAEARGEPAKPVAEMHMGAFELLTMVVVAFAVVLALPVLSAGQAPLGLLIVGFGLWEAWKLTRGTSLAIEGPFRAVPAASPPSAA